MELQNSEERRQSSSTKNKNAVKGSRIKSAGEPKNYQKSPKKIKPPRRLKKKVEKLTPGHFCTFCSILRRAFHKYMRCSHRTIRDGYKRDSRACFNDMI